jgi:hypothetical protein
MQRALLFWNLKTYDTGPSLSLAFATVYFPRPENIPSTIIYIRHNISDELRDETWLNTLIRCCLKVANMNYMSVITVDKVYQEIPQMASDGETGYTNFEVSFYRR